MSVSYPYLRAWGARLGSYHDYVDQQLALASADKAPQDVIFANTEEQEARSVHPAAADDPHVYRANGRVWHRFGGVTNSFARAYLVGYVARVTGRLYPHSSEPARGDNKIDNSED